MTTIDEDRQLLRDFKRLRRQLRKSMEIKTLIREQDLPYLNPYQTTAVISVGNDLDCATSHVDDIIARLKKTIRYKEINHGNER